MARIVLENVSKVFATHTAVEDLDLDIADGEFFVLLGPTGAGKTTTLRLIAGLEKPTVGHIRIDGEVVNDWSPSQRDVALVLQQYWLYPRLTVRDNLSFPLRSKLCRASAQEIEDRVAYAARTLRIEHLLDRKTERLSGGEMQRVSIGRAIVRQPQVFLMDEPQSNLDAKLREAMRSELKDLQIRLGTTFLFVTQDQVEAMTMGDRMGIFEYGPDRTAGHAPRYLPQPAKCVCHRLCRLAGDQSACRADRGRPGGDGAGQLRIAAVGDPRQGQWRQSDLWHQAGGYADCRRWAGGGDRP